MSSFDSVICASVDIFDFALCAAKQSSVLVINESQSCWTWSLGPPPSVTSQFNVAPSNEPDASIPALEYGLWIMNMHVFCLGLEW